MTSPRTRLGDSNDPRIEAQQAGTGTREYSAIPEPTSDNTEAVLKALKESVEGMLGSRGSLQSNGVLVEDLESLGLIRVEDNGFVRNTITDVIPTPTPIAEIVAASVAAVLPVGSLYSSVVSTSPATLFGIGTWVRIGAGVLLMDGGGGFTEGTQYGQATSNAHGHGAGTLATGAATSNAPTNLVAGATFSTGVHLHPITGSVANNSPTTNDNYPPTLAIYVWKRTA